MSKFEEKLVIMTATAIRTKLYDYIKSADDKKIKAIYTILEGEIEENFDHWTDKNFLAELNRRSEEYKSGNVKGIAWEEAKKRIKSANKKK
jgi:putative addiction module component (TIGR02574 family)